MDLLIRNRLLMALEAASRQFGLRADVLGMGLQNAGLPVSTEVLKNHLHYLQGKELITEERQELDRSQAVYKITAKGEDYLAEQNL